MTIVYTTREAQRSSQGPYRTIWFQTDEGKVSIEMTEAALREFHSLIGAELSPIQPIKTGINEVL